MSRERPRKEKVARSVLWAASVLPGAPKRLAPRRVTAAWHSSLTRPSFAANTHAAAWTWPSVQHSPPTRHRAATKVSSRMIR